MNSELQRICDFMLSNALYRGYPSITKLQEYAAEIAAINWEEYIADQGRREDAKKDHLIPCPSCGKPATIREIEPHWKCNACLKAIWDTQAIPCINCGTLHLSGKSGVIDPTCDAPTCQLIRSQIAPHNKRAEDAGLPATLTLRQWVKTIKFFNGKCAYCQGSFQVLEHYIPLPHGGTTQTNCFPSCHKCNHVKNDKLPEQFERLFPTENIQRIKEYIAKCG